MLREYWGNLTLVLRGSVTRGRADQYSDIDFVFFCGDDVFHAVIERYRSLGVTARTDGVFVPLPNWIGHYHYETYAKLKGYFDNRDMPQAWECINVELMHDPKSVYAGIVREGTLHLFDNHLKIVKDRYIDLMLTLDLLSHPLLRGDKIAALLHCAKFIRTACQLCYLMDRKASA